MIETNSFVAAVLGCCIATISLMTLQLFVTADTAARRLSQGAQTDTGIFPKRSKNVNAWYLSAGAPGGTGTVAYPLKFPAATLATPAPYQAGLPARIVIAPTTACPIFRAQDDGSTDPLLIG